MAAIDFARLRNQTMADGLDSEVTVNTRALIDKVLARYSSEHTTLRELIQNAADAKADTVTIRFETDPSLSIPTPHGAEDFTLLKHIIQNHTMKRLVVTNNGQPFTTADWNRLKSIADGNPDETKIGAFGVGFYSVFADCDEPFVVSGKNSMAFYWKGNTLSTKLGVLPSDNNPSSTTFMLDYRQANRESPSYNPSKLPNLPTLCQFLATSLTFVGLETIELHVDDYVLASFSKKISPPEEIRVPQGLKTETEGGLMRVTRVTRQHSQIDAEWLNVIATAQDPPKRAATLVQQEVRNAGNSLKSFFSRFSAPPVPAPSKEPKALQTDQASVDGGDSSGESKGTIFLQVCTIEVATRVSRNFAAEIERATKKAPPKTTKIALLTAPYQDQSLATGSGKTANLASKIFAEVLPTKAGRIFIGFPTAQTTGYLVHVSAPSLIPTVERENVDMNARYISTWNIELLRVAGLGCHITYSSEMASIQARAVSESVDCLVPRTIYTFQQYTTTTSHPSTSLGEKIEEAFWNCSKERSVEILSSKGVMASKRVRMPAETLSFLGEVPMVPQELANGAVAFMLNLHNRGFISELTMQDIRQGLESRALNEAELLEFLKWCGAKLESRELDIAASRNLFDITVANIEVQPEKNSGRILALGDVNTYVNPARITPNLPLPPDTIPFVFTKAISLKQLQTFGWIELSMVRWLRHMMTQPQLEQCTKDEPLATTVLSLASKCWEQLDTGSKETVVKILTPHAIMPTKMGMRCPAETYFTTVKLFDDLPTVKPFPGSKEKFLLALGVRKTIDLPVVFARMRTSDTANSSWNHVDLIRYFASVIDEIPKKDLDRLRDTPFLPGQGATVKDGQLFKASDLYAPDQAILDLGLTQIKLPYKLKTNMRDGVLLLRLGLRQWPDSIAIAQILHHSGRIENSQLYKLAMEYFLQNYFRNNYAAEAQKLANLSLPILPTQQAPFPALVGPSQCYTNESVACLGFAILRSDLRPHAEKFGVQRDPSLAPCIKYLIKTPPETQIDAEMQFAYFATRAAEFDHNKGLVSTLSTTNIVPVFRKYFLDPTCMGFEDRTKKQMGKTEMRLHHHDPPEHVFVGRDQEYRGILDYVQYGAEATAFLLKIGAKHEPSTHDLASLLARNPARFLNTIGQEKYLDLLRKLAEHADDIWKDKDLVKCLVASKALLGYRDIKEDVKKHAAATAATVDDDLDDLDEPIVQREWSLNSASAICIVDQVQLLIRFRDYIIAAPQEEGLEEFYARFGVQKISELVKTEQRIGPVVRDQTPAQDLREEIMERVRLFLHEYERDSSSSKAIKHDAKWLNSNLVVQCVSDISIRYSLPERNVASSSRKSAVVVKIRGQGYVLSITPKYDLYDVSTELVRLLISRPKRNDAFGLERILTEPLRRLQQKGINVERILRRKEHEARIAQQQELEREYEEQQRAAEQAKAGLNAVSRREEQAPPATPDRSQQMPGSFGSPDTSMEIAKNNRQPKDDGLINNWAKKLGFKTESTPRTDTDGPQINRDVQATKSNIQSAIKDCRPTGMQDINTKHHQDPTELDRGGYCNGEQWENLHKAFSVPFAGRHIDIYYGQEESAGLVDLQSHLSAFLPLIFGLTAIFTVNPAAVNIFLDKKSNTVAFNLNGSLFFNLAWFIALHSEGWSTREGRLRALDSWFCTYCHELAHNLVGDHNARHSWYQQQIIIEYSQQFRAALEGYTQGLLAQA